MSGLVIQGVNDLPSVGAFTSSAANLGLGADNEKLQTFIQAADKAGALSAGKPDMGAIDTAVFAVQGKGVLAAGPIDSHAVLTLVQSAKALGITGANAAGKIANVQKIAAQYGLSSAPYVHSGSQPKSSGNHEPPADAGKAITWRKLHFAPYPFKDILDLKIIQAINEHAYLYLCGVLPEDSGTTDYVQSTGADTEVALSYVDEHKQVKYLFCGVVKTIRQRTVAGVKQLEIEALSHSSRLDVQKHSGSFQRHNEPYSYIFDRINAKVKEYVPNLTGKLLFASGNEDSKPTGKLMIQYRESDWEFLKRLASHFGQPLITDPTMTNPKIYLGLPPSRPNRQSQENANGQAGQQAQPSSGPELNVADYYFWRDTEGYAKATGNCRKNSGVAFSENDFTYCETESFDVLSLGQGVTFLNRNFYVRGIHTTMDKGTVKNVYTLATKQGMLVDDLYNRNLPGVSLQGKVKAISKDQVKVHIFEIDPEYDSGGTWLYAYTTVYSSPGGSGLYIMPEVGDNVRIYFSNQKEEEAVAVSSINLTPSKRGARTDPDQKVISTVHGKQVVITPGGISVIANDGLNMTLLDDGGVTITSDKKIVLDAKEEVEISSQANTINVNAPVIGLEQGGSTIDLTNIIKVGGNKVKVQP
jgi:hypothetical protein